MIIRHNTRISKLGEASAETLASNPDFFTQAFDIGNFRFVPFITRSNWLACELEILFLRCEPPGYIVDGESGDIDNRIKVLFDALRMPLEANELPGSAIPEAGERPFYCLLADDSLITAFKLESERLLYPQPTSDAEVQLIVRVQVKMIKATWGNLGMG